MGTWVLWMYIQLWDNRAHDFKVVESRGFYSEQACQMEAKARAELLSGSTYNFVAFRCYNQVPDPTVKEGK